MKNDAVQEYVAVKDLVHAYWNPRTVEELSPSHPAMMELVESVKALGVIQPIAVWVHNVDGERQATVIAGNRRAEAAKIARIERVPALVYVDGELTLEEAQSITRSENEVRLGVDPILDSQLIKRMLDQGMSQQEIAAKLGTSEATVCRRMKLCDLSDDFVKLWRENSERISVKALEAVAAHGSLQGQLFKEMKYQARGGTMTHAAVMSQIRRITQKIDPEDWMFKAPNGADLLAACRCCSHYTGNQADLFAVDFSDAGDACRCEDCVCYKRMCEKAKDALIRAKVGAGTPIVVVNGTWELPDVGGKKSKKNCVAYVAWSDWEHRVEKVKYAPTQKEIEAEKRRIEEDKKARQKVETDARARLYNARKTIEDAFDYGKRDELVEAAAETILAPYKSSYQNGVMKNVIRAALNSYSYELDREKLLCAFPEFAAKLGITNEMMKELEDAQSALDAIIHPEGEDADEDQDEE